MPSVFFLHGNSQNHTCGRFILDDYRRLGLRTLYYDLPGHGVSALFPNPYGFDDLVTLHGHILDALDLIDPILIGHSLGGMIQAAAITRRQHHNARLVLIGSYDANPLSVDDGGEVQALLDEYLKENKQRFSQQVLFDYAAHKELDDDAINRVNQQHTQPAACRQNLTTIGPFNARQALIDLGVPILALHGRQDEVIPASLMEDMARAHHNLCLEWYQPGAHYAFFQQHHNTRRFLQKHHDFLCNRPLKELNANR